MNMEVPPSQFSAARSKWLTGISSSWTPNALAAEGSRIRRASFGTLTAGWFVLLTTIFVVSPLLLYFSRFSSLVAVFALIAITWGFLLSTRTLERVPTPVDAASGIFFAYMSLNCVAALISGHPRNEAIAELIPPLELYLCFQAAKRVPLSKGIVAAWLKWILVFATARAVWQVLATLVLLHLHAPIYGPLDRIPMGSIGAFSYERPFEPMCGIMLVVALILYNAGIERRLALQAAGTTLVVVILGSTRSEWIATILAMLIVMFYLGRWGQTLKNFVVIGLAVTVACFAWPDLYRSLSDRLIATTSAQIEQFEQLERDKLKPDERPAEEKSAEDVTIGALRILEFNVALTQFRTAPLFGHGLGSGIGTDVIKFGGGHAFIRLHNSYLNLLTNAGLVGVGLLLIVLLNLRKYLISSLRLGDTEVQALFSLGAGTLAWYGIFMAFQPIYVSYHLPVIIGTFWGVATRLSKRVDEVPMNADHQVFTMRP